MHFKKRNSLRITYNFDHLLERVFIMPITRNDIIDCLNKLTGYGEELKENLAEDRKKYKQIIETKAATFNTYRAGFSDSIAEAYDKIINFKISFSGVQDEIQKIIDGARKKISDKSTLDKFNRAAISIKSQINASKYSSDVIKKTKAALTACESKLDRIFIETKVDPSIEIADETCSFRELSDTLQETLTEGDNLDFLNELKEPTTTGTIIDAFRKKSVFIYNKELAAGTKPLPKKYISEYRESLVVYGKAIQRCLNTNRIFCQTEIERKVEKLKEHFSTFVQKIPEAFSATKDCGISTIARDFRKSIEDAIAKISGNTCQALEQTQNNVLELIDQEFSLSKIEEEEKVQTWYEECSKKLKEIQEHTKINPDVKIGEKTYKFIDLIDAVKTSVVNDPKSDILAGLDDYKLENSIISSFIDADVYVTER